MGLMDCALVASKGSAALGKQSSADFCGAATTTRGFCHPSTYATPLACYLWFAFVRGSSWTVGHHVARQN